jgi:hypothetical protein
MRLMSRTGFVRWRDRPALRLANDVVELTSLLRGGHLAELRFTTGSGYPGPNVLWDAPWMHEGYPADEVAERMDTAGMTGHGLCLDYFGPPSAAEARAGLGIHGEAVALEWKATIEENPTSALWQAKLPAAQLELTRRVTLKDKESAFFVEEVVTNQRPLDHACHWVQHVTFSPPFLTPGDSRLVVSAKRGFTDEGAYGERSLLAHNREFLWPLAPSSEGSSEVDLSLPFTRDGRGLLAGLELDPTRDIEFLAAINWRLELGVGYCFRRADFPWMAVWEENGARQDEPWKGVAQARGMEFGTTPLPLGRERMFTDGMRYEKSCWTVIPAYGRRTARFVIFLFTGLSSINRLADVVLGADEVRLLDGGGSKLQTIQMRGVADFLLGHVPGEYRFCPGSKH